MGKLFGTDGVRGIANTELTCEMAFNLGRAGAYVLTKETNHTPKIIVGKDTRVSGDMLEAALTAGMCSVGAAVFIAGVIPTPGIAYIVKKHNFDAGVVISASHNPVEDNGIKFFNGEGYKLHDDIENEIEELINNGLESLPHPVGSGVGCRRDFYEALDDYAEFLIKSAGGVKLDGIRVALDCANGATYKAAPAVLAELETELYTIHNEPDGSNINFSCGSTHIESLVEYVKTNQPDIGFAFDGDGDRVLAVDENGDVVDGDELMAIFADYYKKEGSLQKNTLVATVMSNLGLFVMCGKNGIHTAQTAVGDRYILEELLKSGCSLGGEPSGHIINLNFNTTGDGILMAVQLLVIMKNTGKKLSELKKVMQKLPQVLLNARIPNDKKKIYMENEIVAKEITSLNEMLADEGRVLIRPSGTEPLVRVMIEGKDEAFIYEQAKRIVDIMEKELA